MRPTQVMSALRSLLPTKHAVFLRGAPGIGKSNIVRQVGADLDMPVYDWRALYRDPVDARGVPSVRDGMTYWNVPAELAEFKRGIFFMDEVAQAPPMMQQVCGQAALERRIADYQFPDEVYIVAASNRAEDRAGANRVLTNVLNRFIHLELEVSNEDWQAWAIDRGLAPEVRAYLNYRPAHLNAGCEAGDWAYATPRSWEMLSDVLPLTPGECLHAVAAGCVGKVAAEFMGFLGVYQSLPSIDAILANPTGHAVPKEATVQYALCGALAERVRGADAKTMAAVAKYGSRLPKEFQMLCFRDGGATNRQFLTTKEMGPWLRENQALLLPALGAR